MPRGVRCATPVVQAANLGQRFNLRMPSSTSSAIYQQEARVSFLETLYLADHRENRDHPLHGRYTGLFVAACEQMGRKAFYECIEELCHSPEDMESLSDEFDSLLEYVRGKN